MSSERYPADWQHPRPEAEETEGYLDRHPEMMEMTWDDLVSRFDHFRLQAGVPGEWMATLLLRDPADPETEILVTQDSYGEIRAALARAEARDGEKVLVQSGTTDA
jgi:predicted 2-oxoglutarate/Fe(II)-dependent dioxygenase YbiX